MNFKEQHVIELLEGSKEVTPDDLALMRLAITGAPKVLAQAPKSWRNAHMGAVEMGG